MPSKLVYLGVRSRNRTPQEQPSEDSVTALVYALIAPSEPSRFHHNCRNTTIDIAICKGMTVSECTSIL
ncbi:hypothetical protein TNCV_472111 [Trichonephila clavipes]|nr:hypothetical protein TNCV_472111 [Trichonephila clavipes]